MKREITKRRARYSRDLVSILFGFLLFLSFPSSFCYLRWPCMSGGERGPGSTTTTIFDQVSPKTEEDCGESRQDSTVGSQVTAAIFQRIIPQACISRTRAREESRHQYSPSHGKNYKNIGE